MVWRYYLSILKRAGQDWLEFFDLHHIGGWAKLLIPSLISAAVQLRLLGLETMLGEISGTAFVYGLGALGWIIVIFLFLLSLAPARIDKEQKEAARNLEIKNRELTEPKMEITFGQGSPHEVSQPLHDPEDRAVRGTKKIFRVGLHNRSDAKTITGVYVELGGSEPEIEPTMPLPLHLLHGIGGPTFELNPGETKYFEVLSIFEDTNTDLYRENFAIEHTVDGVICYCPINNHRFKIDAWGNNVPSAHRYFRFGMGDDGKAFFKPE